MPIKYVKCSQCETDTQHIKGECQKCGTFQPKKFAKKVAKDITKIAKAIHSTPKATKKPSLQIAFEITQDDVETVVDQFIGATKRLLGKKKLSVEKIFDQLQVDLVSACALQGDEMDEQTNLAHAEIKRQIEVMAGMTKKPAKTKKRKVAKKPKEKFPPSECPNKECQEGESIDYESPIIDGNEVSQKCRCIACDTQWQEVYKYSHRQVI